MRVKRCTEGIGSDAIEAVSKERIRRGRHKSLKVLSQP